MCHPYFPRCKNDFQKWPGTEFAKEIVSKQVLYLPNQMHFPIGGERVTCHGSALTITEQTNEKTTWTLDPHVIRRCALPTAANLCASRRQANNFFAVCSIIVMRDIPKPPSYGIKDLMTGITGNSEFCFPSIFNTEGIGKSNELIVSLGGQSLSA